LHFWQLSKPSFVLVQRITFHFCLLALRQRIEVGGNPFENPDDGVPLSLEPERTLTAADAQVQESASE
jgi:hypothetical protein